MTFSLKSGDDGGDNSKNSKLTIDRYKPAVEKLPDSYRYFIIIGITTGTKAP
jgi:hypothetical protein